MSRPQRLSVTADEELNAAIGGDRVLMLRLVPFEVRPAIEALWRVDAAMGDVVARATQPALAAVKLAWWRERLGELDTGPPPAEPRLRAAAEYLLPANVTGAELAALEDGWAALLEEHVDAARVAERGIQLFRLAARLLGADESRTGEAAALYALVSVGRRDVSELMDKAGTYLRPLARQRFSRPLRPLTGLARLAVRDLKRGAPFETEGSPPRLAAMLRHRLTGRI